jgi:hypothetical protein
MGFKDLFRQKLQIEQEAVAATRVVEQRALSEHEQLVAELEPKLRALVLEVFAEMAAAGVQAVDVSKDGFGREKTGAKAYALGRVDFGWRGTYARAAIDSEGRLAFKQSMQSRETPAGRSVTGSWTLNDRYDLLLSTVARGDEPYRDGIQLTSTGELLFSQSYWGVDETKQYRGTPLPEYLAQLAAETVAKA